MRGTEGRAEEAKRRKPEETNKGRNMSLRPSTNVNYTVANESFGTSCIDHRIIVGRRDGADKFENKAGIVSEGEEKIGCAA
jgi:hypothetical protein